MIPRWARIIAVGLLTAVLWVNPAYAQRKKNQPEPVSGPSFPMGQYALVVILLALPIGLVCYSSRR